MSKPNALWKLTIDPRGKGDPTADSFGFCRERGIVGVGWPFSGPPETAEGVVPTFRREYQGSRLPPAMKILASRAKNGDHVWVYGDRKHYICKIVSAWRHEAGAEWDLHDIHNVRDAEWREVPVSLVPGIVRRKLTMYGTAQIITDDEGWCHYSEQVFRSVGSPESVEEDLDIGALRATLRASPDRRVFEILDPDETEDVVGLFLQEVLGWRMIKSSTYRSQRDVECHFTRAQGERFETAVMQVKSGGTVTLRPCDYQNLSNAGIRVFLFSTASPPYRGESCPGVESLSQEVIANFVIEKMNLLPRPTLMRLAYLTQARPGSA